MQPAVTNGHAMDGERVEELVGHDAADDRSFIDSTAEVDGLVRERVLER